MESERLEWLEQNAWQEEHLSTRSEKKDYGTMWPHGSLKELRFEMPSKHNTEDLKVCAFKRSCLCCEKNKTKGDKSGESYH